MKSPSLTAPGAIPGDMPHADPEGPPAMSTMAGRWRTRAQQTIVLRVPTGLAAMAGLATLLMLVLAYWAGHTRGGRDVQMHVGQSDVDSVQYHPINSAADDRQMDVQPYFPDPSVVPQNAQTEVVARKLGYNYFVLAHYPQVEAQHLVDFLSRHGVDAAAFKPHNRRLFQVVALRGFRREEINGTVRQEYEQKLRQLGRTWKSKRYGPDFAQTGIYLDLFENEEVVETLTPKEDQL